MLFIIEAGGVVVEVGVPLHIATGGGGGEPAEPGEPGEPGASAYEVAVAAGFVGTVEQWLASLTGEAGASAYGVAVAAGFVGTVEQWLASLTGEAGASAYEVAVAAGFVGTVGQWLASLTGEAGASAYGVAVAAGFVGTVEQWLASLKGEPGPPDPAVAAEVAEARGDRGSLAARISTISNFASPNAGGTVPGRFYDNAFQGTNGSTLTGAANQLTLAPFFTSAALTVDQIGVAVSTTVSGVLARCCIYEAGPDGWPRELVFEGPSPVDLGFANFRAHTLATPFRFDTGRQYWVGVLFSGAGVIRSINTSSAVNLGLTQSSAGNYATVLRRSWDFGTPLPAVWDFDPADLTAAVTPPSIRMRAVSG